MLPFLMQFPFSPGAARSVVPLAALLFAAAGCSGSEGSGGGNGAGASAATTGATTGAGSQPIAIDVFGSKYSTIELEVDYATGAEPYTGNLIGFGDVWDIFETNAARLYQGQSKTFVVPTELAAMQELTDVTATQFTTDDIFAIVAKHRDKPSKAPTATFYVLWLNGKYVEDGEENPGVLGINYGGTGVIAMFKPVIEGTSAGPGLNVEKFSEQATLVHEFGHAVGLVNNGVSMATPHQDTAHGAHCSNPDCIMYWTIDGASGMVDFLQKTTLSNQTILFGDECLADVDAAGK